MGLDMMSKDRKYWSDVFKNWSKQTFFEYTKNHMCFRDHDDGEFSCCLKPEKLLNGNLAVIKHIRSARYVVRMRRNCPSRGMDPVRDYGYEIGMAIEAAIEKSFGDLECVDNVRFARVSSRKDMRRYRAQQQSGCCGSTDHVEEINGEKYLIGCNFGH
jgi:hypothetical protein